MCPVFEEVILTVLLQKWKKFGLAENHPEGPSTSTTIVGEEVFLLLAKDKNFDIEDSSDKILLKTAPKSIQCRHCKGDHWTSKCPFKDMAPSGASTEDNSPEVVVAPTSGGSRYVPPSLRNKDATDADGGRDDSCTIRLTNLPDYCADKDLRELCSFLRISRAFLSKDFDTGKCKGYAFVTYETKEDAGRAIAILNGHGYGNLILKAEWAARK